MKKKVLFPILALVLALGLAIPMAAAPVVASPAYIETIYLADTLDIDGTPDGTTIFTVELDDGTNRANLTYFCDMPPGQNARYDTVAALACSPDGGTLYVIDRDTSWLARYDIATTTWFEVGDTDLNTCVQLVCSGDGTLYAASNATDSLYTVSTSDASTTLLGKIRDGTTTGPVVDVSGADIAFGVDDAFPPNEILYLWTDGGSPAERGLWELSLPPVEVNGGVVIASRKGGTSPPKYTGLAIRAGGAGDLLGSNTGDDDIDQLDRSVGSVVKSYEMYLGVNPYAYEWGDMTLGELAVEEGNPCIEVEKSTPELAYFNGTEITYTYEVHNCGDFPLENVSVVDDLAGPASPVMGNGYNVGDDNPPDGYLDPCETWQFTADYTLTCPAENYWSSVVLNTATATAYYEAEPVTAEDMWKVIVFQWQPRTIGYWGNWENHYDWYEEDGDNNFQALVEAAFGHSANLQFLATHLSWELTADDDGTDIHDFLLGKPPKLTGTHKAMFLMEKQFLAAAFNVWSYVDWVTPGTIGEFTGTADAAMDPNAPVYLSGKAADVFGSETTVLDILHTIAAQKLTWFSGDDVSSIKAAQEVLDMMNNAEHNGYEVFVPQETGVLNLHEKDSDTWEIVTDGAWGALFYNLSGKEFQYLFYGYGLEATEYSLIYYADYEDRYVDWGGDNPGAVIATGTASSDLVMAGSIDLAMDLPDEDDYNYDTHDYSGAPDFYDHAHGAKIWLVPSACLTGGDLPVVVWSPDDFLFETDLIWYDDTDD